MKNLPRTARKGTKMIERNYLSPPLFVSFRVHTKGVIRGKNSSSV